MAVHSRHADCADAGRQPDQRRGDQRWHRPYLCGRVNGSVTCWGKNQFGQLGDGTTDPTLDASGSVLGVTNVRELAAGNGYTCVVDGRGTGRCWGRNTNGELGNGTAASTAVASTVTGALPSLS